MESKSVIEDAAAPHRRHQVCIFGAGPAGLAASARLLDCGRDVMVFERAPTLKPWGGESLMGAIRAPLKTLGMWDVFRRAGHVEGHERQWAWGGEPQVESAIFEPHGALWHVDRDRFDDDLRLTVHQRGGLFHTYRRLDSVTKLAGKWQIRLDGQDECTADFIVDATGRTRALPRRLDARVVPHDRLIALTAAVPREESGAAIRSMLVASTPFGWWYTSPTPKGHVAALLQILISPLQTSVISCAPYLRIAYSRMSDREKAWRRWVTPVRRTIRCAAGVFVGRWKTEFFWPTRLMRGSPAESLRLLLNITNIANGNTTLI